MNGNIRTRNRRFLRKLTGPESFGRINTLVSVDERTEKKTTQRQQNKISQQLDVAEDSIHKTDSKIPGVTTWEDNRQKHKQCGFCNKVHKAKPTYTHKEKMGATLAASTLKYLHLKTRPKMVLTGDMTNSGKLAWFEAVEKCLGDSGPRPRNPEEHQLPQRLVFDCISPKLLIMLSEDGEAGEILEGGRELLAKLRRYALPVNIRRYDFQSSKQKRGEEFNTWWEKKTAMAQLCELDTMSRSDILVTQLVQGVQDTDLKRTLIDKIEDNLTGLVKIARTWCHAGPFSKLIEMNEQLMANQPSKLIDILIDDQLAADQPTTRGRPHRVIRRTHEACPQGPKAQATLSTKCTRCDNLLHHEGHHRGYILILEVLKILQNMS